MFLSVSGLTRCGMKKDGERRGKVVVVVVVVVVISCK